MPRKTSNDRGFLSKYWFQIITIIIAICGGFPGIINIVKYFHNKPIFGFEPNGLIWGELPQEDVNIPFLVLFGTVTNQGDKPLNPRFFDMKIRDKGKWFALERYSLPVDANCEFHSETQLIIAKDLAKIDLQEWKEPILIGQPARGCLMFFSKDIDIQELKDSNSLTYQLKCMDIFNKTYTVTSTYGPFSDVKSLQKLIKYNVTFGPKS